MGCATSSDIHPAIYNQIGKSQPKQNGELKENKTLKIENKPNHLHGEWCQLQFAKHNLQESHKDRRMKLFLAADDMSQQLLEERGMFSLGTLSQCTSKNASKTASPAENKRPAQSNEGIAMHLTPVAEDKSSRASMTRAENVEEVLSNYSIQQDNEINQVEHTPKKKHIIQKKGKLKKKRKGKKLSKKEKKLQKEKQSEDSDNKSIDSGLEKELDNNDDNIANLQMTRVSGTTSSRMMLDVHGENEFNIRDFLKDSNTNLENDTNTVTVREINFNISYKSLNNQISSIETTDEKQDIANENVRSIHVENSTNATVENNSPTQVV